MSMIDHDEAPVVAWQDACPACGERHQDSLVWTDDERVACQACGAIYEPGSKGDDHGQP